MRDKEELDSIALQWAYENMECWQHEWDSWDNLIEEHEMTDEEWEYCRSRNFKIEIEN